MQCKKENCTNCVLLDDLCKRHLKQKCSVCLENVPSTNSAQTKRLTCGHSFHFRCIIKWYEFSEECPVCRKKQSRDDLILFKNNVENKIREKYKEVIRSYERELKKLRRPRSVF